MKRNKYGQIVLDQCKLLDDFTKGRKNKCWFEIGNDRYLFKTGSSNYEIWAELIACELAQQVGIETAIYDLAIYNGQIGVITKDFARKDELVIPGDAILTYAQQILKENNSSIIADNSVEGIIVAMSITNNGRFDYQSLWENLTERWAFDGLIMESDRNPTNWSIIRGRDRSLRLAPLYDCSTMARMNNNIRGFIDNMNSSRSLEVLTDSIKYSMTFYNASGEDNSDNFLYSFANFCADYTDLAGQIIQNLSCIDVDEAIQNVEERISQGTRRNEVPWECSLWLNKIIQLRLTDMQNIYINQLEKSKSKRKIG